MSLPFAAEYVDQFPKKKTEHLARTVSFIAGSLATVLGLASVIDPELFLNFEVTPDRAVVFYFTICITVWATARGTLSDETGIFSPEFALRNVMEYTHYEPDHWKGRLHSFEVKKEFCELYKIKLLIFVEEILSILVIPLILFTSLPRSSDQIIDFFREFTIHVDGLGYICSFAEFNFQRNDGNPRPPADNGDVRDDYYSTKHGKMAQSYYGFLDKYHYRPKTGMPGSLGPGTRNHFYPPPAFPGLNSPTLAADMQHSRIGRHDRGRSRAGAARVSQPPRTPRAGLPPPLPSPMGSMLLDPHHIPAAVSLGARNGPRARHSRAEYHGDSDIIEERGENGAVEQTRSDDDAGDESRAGLEESTWQTSPPKGLSRENSGVQDEGAEVGVLGLMYQFQQAHMNRGLRSGVR